MISKLPKLENEQPSPQRDASDAAVDAANAAESAVQTQKTMETIRPYKVGAGPRWEPVMKERASFYGDLAFGNGNQKTIGMHKTGSGLFIGVEAASCGHFSTEVTANQVGIKLKLTTLDARNMADFINTQLEVDTKGMEQGDYQFKYCLP